MSNVNLPSAFKEISPPNKDPDEKSRESEESPRSSVEGSILSERNIEREAQAGLEIFKLVHRVFPTSAIIQYKDKLISQYGDRRINNRKFFKGDKPPLCEAFEEARLSFNANTLDKFCQKVEAKSKESKTPSSSSSTSSSSSSNNNIIDSETAGVYNFLFDKGNTYSNPNYKDIEIDCLVKIPVPVDTEFTLPPVTTTPTMEKPVGYGDFFYLTLVDQNLPDFKENSTIPMLRRSSSKNTSFTDENYPPDCSMYVVGEVYSPIGTGERETLMKLFQLERILNFLKTKEDKPIRDCVIGCIFFGHHMTRKVASIVFRAISQNHDKFPCLWSLMGYEVVTSPSTGSATGSIRKYNKIPNVSCRLFGYILKPYIPMLGLDEIDDKLNHLQLSQEKAMNELKQSQEKAMNELKQSQQSQEKAMNELKQSQQSQEKAIEQIMTALQVLQEELRQQRQRNTRRCIIM